MTCTSKAGTVAPLEDAEDRKMRSIVLGQMATNPSFLAGAVATHHAAKLLEGVLPTSAHNVQDAIDFLAEQVELGDLSGVEKMLVAQAVALESVFTQLILKASSMRPGTDLNTVASLALRAQAQSRATLDSLINLKFPRTTVIAKQANVASAGGMQQVNNGVGPSHAPTHEASSQNELLLEANASPILDTRAARRAGRRDPAVEAVGAVNRPAKPRGKSRVVA